VPSHASVRRPISGFRRSTPDYEDLQASKVVAIAVVASDLLL